MKKRFLAAVLCAAMALALLPTAAKAAGATVTIGGIGLPAGKYLASNGTAPQNDAPASGGYAHLSADGATLSLNGFQLNYAGQYGIKIDGASTTLDLTGTSLASLTGPSGIVTPIALWFGNGDTLTVQGTGSLTARAQSATSGAAGVAIYGGSRPGSLLMKSGTLTGEAEGMLVNNAPSGVGVNAGIQTITVENGTLVGQPIATKDCYAGISCGTLNVSGGMLSGQGYQYGVYAHNGMSILGGDVTGICTWKNYGIYVPSSSIADISGGTVRGDCQGMDAHNMGGSGIRGDVKISGGNVLFTGTQSRSGAVNGILDLSSYAVPPVVMASTDKTDTPTDSYDPTKLGTYKSLRIAPNYEITLESPAGITLSAHTFPAQMEGYDARNVPQLTVVVKNTGSRPTGNLAIALSGGGSGAFTLPQTTLSSIAAGGTASFNVGATSGQTPNTYDATVTVSAAPNNFNSLAPRNFTVQFTVNAVTLTVTPSGSARFPVGGALGNAVFTVSANVPLTATANYGGATLDGQPLNLGSVGAPGTDGSVADGSIKATVNQAKLNTLTAGDHPLIMTLQGAPFAGKTVTGVITVTALGDDGGGAGVPKTGDGGMPLLWLGLALLAGAGLGITAKGKRRLVKRR